MPATETNLESRVTLNDGHVMPIFGLGMNKTQNAEEVVLCAIENGYRLLDSAEYYENEEAVGKALKTCDIPREKLFIVSKLWNNGADICKSHFEASRRKLGLDYIDLYLIHSPYGGQNVATYRAMMELQKQGLIRSIGVSNFGIDHLKGLMAEGVPLPVINQVELHPWQQKRELVAFCREMGITVMGFCPLAKGQHLQDTALTEMAKRYNKTPAQILIRWSVQNGFITIPKSANPTRIVENAQVFDWTLDQNDIDILNAMPQKCVAWSGADPCVSPWEG